MQTKTFNSRSNRHLTRSKRCVEKTRHYATRSIICPKKCNMPEIGPEPQQPCIPTPKHLGISMPRNRKAQFRCRWTHREAYRRSRMGCKRGVACRGYSTRMSSADKLPTTYCIAFMFIRSPPTPMKLSFVAYVNENASRSQSSRQRDRRSFTLHIGVLSGVLKSPRAGHGPVTFSAMEFSQLS